MIHEQGWGIKRRTLKHLPMSPHKSVSTFPRQTFVTRVVFENSTMRDREKNLALHKNLKLQWDSLHKQSDIYPVTNNPEPAEHFPVSFESETDNNHRLCYCKCLALFFLPFLAQILQMLGSAMKVSSFQEDPALDSPIF